MPIVDDFRLQLGGSQFVPIMVGGMGVDISNAELALSVCRLGGIAHISDAMSLFVADKHFGTHFTKEKTARYPHPKLDLDKSAVKFHLEDLHEAQHRSVSETMSKKRGDGALFINVMEKLTMAAPADTLKTRLLAALDGGIDGITLSAGLHTHSLAMMEQHPRFRDAKIGIVISSVRALKIFLRSAKRVNRLPDYIVVEGPLAGGHLGFGDDWREYRLQDIVTEVFEFLSAQALEIPVIPAGGIFTGTDAVEYLQSGAAAVQVATRFTISQECGLPNRAKQAYLHAEEKDVFVSSVSPTGYPLRMLASSPCLGSNVKPQCESFGYALGSNSSCAYLDAYAATKTDNKGRKLPVEEKVCLCYHFSKFNCYTCGHYVYRLKDTTHRLADGSYHLPAAADIFHDYQFSKDHEIRVA